jgi:hypothetical protein
MENWLEVIDLSRLIEEVPRQNGLAQIVVIGRT